MTLWDALEHVLDGLADRGWRALLLRHGLDIAVRPVSDELLRALAGIDRTLTGFLDFAPQGRRSIEPGDPARSLLYHALASPLVHPTTDGTPGPSELYPSLQDLDTLENLIYALAAPSVSIAELVPAVFAYEYRPAYRTPHGQHADLVFARTGIARFGTTAAHYERALRCHVSAAGSPSDVRAMPARYGLFLARRIAGRASWSTDRQRGVVTILGGPDEATVRVISWFRCTSCSPAPNASREQTSRSSSGIGTSARNCGGRAPSGTAHGSTKGSI